MAHITVIGFAALILGADAHAVRAGRVVPVGQMLAVGQVSPECTGTLIHPQVVITAAHCLRVPLAMTSFFWTDAGGRVSEYRVKKRVIHSEDLSQEVALLILRNPVPISPEALPRLADSAPEVGHLARVVGYGLGGRDLDSGTRRSGRMRIEGVGEPPYEGGEPMLVAGTGPRNTITCVGDSGGPIFTEDGRTLLGIVSFGVSSVEGFEFMSPVQQCLHAEQTYFVPVWPYRAWIEKQTPKVPRSTGVP